MKRNLQQMFYWAVRKAKSLPPTPSFQINISGGKAWALVIFNLFKVSRRVGWMKPLYSAHWLMTTMEDAFLIEPNIAHPTSPELPFCRHHCAPPPPAPWVELEWRDNSFNSCKPSNCGEYTQGRFIWFMINSCECGWSPTFFILEAASQNRSQSQRLGQNNCISPKHLFRVSKLVSTIISF